MTSKAFKLGAVTVAIALAAYWYWSPLLAIHQMREAARSGDADAFNDHVDYPKLRDNLKGQLSVAFARSIENSPKAENEFARAGAALGTMLGLSLVDRMVDALVRPETVMRAMQQGKMMPKRQADTSPSTSSPSKDEPVQWQSERKGVDKYIAYASSPGQAKSQRIGLVLERSGFANWKLTEIRLPALD